MTVREAVHSIVGLTGSLQICGCTAGSSGFSLAQGAITALNRAMQAIYLSPLARQMARESVTITFSTTAAVDLTSDVLHVVGPARWNGMLPIALAATETEFNSYHAHFPDEHFDGPLYDDIVFNDPHDVTGGLPYYGTELYLPLWDDRDIIVYFDVAARTYDLGDEPTATTYGRTLNSRAILVRVEIPAVDTPAVDIVPLVVAALNQVAGEFVEASAATTTKVRVRRRRTIDVQPWSIHDEFGVNVGVTAGPRVPVIAWAEELKATTGDDPSRVRLHLLPPAVGSVSVYVIKEPDAFTMEDLDCDADGTNSTVIMAAHQFAESLVLPLARMYFAQDNAAFLTEQSAAMMPSIVAAGEDAKASLGMTPAGMSQHVQRTQTTEHAHP